MIEYDRNIDIVNIEVFQRFGVEAPSVPRHRCVICKKPVSIDDSYSFGGHMLICERCFYKHFNGELHKVNEWKNEEDSIILNKVQEKLEEKGKDLEAK